MPFIFAFAVVLARGVLPGVAVSFTASDEQRIERRSAARAFDTLLRREAGMREMSDLLTSREIQIVRGVAQGLRNKAVAEALHISEGTVKTHLHTICEKLKVQSRAQLIVYCQEGEGTDVKGVRSCRAGRSNSLHLRRAGA